MKDNSKKIIYLLLGAVLFLLGLVAGLSIFIITKNNSEYHSTMDHEQVPATNKMLEKRASPDPVSPKKVEKYLAFPSSWISEDVDIPKKQGYSLLFDLAETKKLILEKCTALIYLDPITKKAIPPRPSEGDDFCVSLVWNDIIHVNNDSVIVKDEKQGTEVILPFTISVKNARIQFNGVEINLVPGSRNDLLQKIEALESVRKEKDEALRQMRSVEPKR